MVEPKHSFNSGNKIAVEHTSLLKKKKSLEKKWAAYLNIAKRNIVKKRFSHLINSHVLMAGVDKSCCCNQAPQDDCTKPDLKQSGMMRQWSAHVRLPLGAIMSVFDHRKFLLSHTEIYQFVGKSLCMWALSIPFFCRERGGGGRMCYYADAAFIRPKNITWHILLWRPWTSRCLITCHSSMWCLPVYIQTSIKTRTSYCVVLKWKASQVLLNSQQ